ncbi:sulfite exporter TauE/SafE family protein [Tenacibaculum finnmarkense]|uniref:Sulfite exporter TauE/SafE family protein n=1 Tax=Tenacibaculum finnmarkense genomovar finnmarkense TaxID=1458503 RepID=A0AAP1REF2_9FLAO|nr:sulfite exporter TauE/SafE family protein [Tenacibaculum finnmarkense]MBE7652296.1 sulfite exporter TauE/SafE family protein [Tenacibaculum finnmarkense genomovar finnmarkense]MBE7691441.1 sulfite exporter TauE/SafE family protein [Tenacibaculum finnmarkense genomovar finnmarkense]MBE7694532.1 sulfite exporter TauE/SafE family protein [Tenacibaculum finnmarkense genomovar finnmarkense]MCD8402061.1 sulfite exporter TauE/SafE family protein [Tenacibaculum finnmarkense genomovar finnmarkense]M
MFLSALIFGLLGSFHCIGMCGPIAFMLPVDRTNKITQFFQILSYHFGRLFTYSLIGLLFGFLGKGFYFFGFQQQLSIAAGILMILVILLPKTFQKYNFSKPINKWVMKVKSSLGKELKNKGNDTFFTIGFLNGFLPCGLVYMAVFGALASSNALSGSLYMFLFGLGTVPLMTIIVYVGNFANGLLRKTIQQAIPYVVVFIGILFILRGLGLGIPYISPLPVSNLTAPIQGCH